MRFTLKKDGEEIMEQKELAVQQLFKLTEMLVTYMWPMQTSKSSGLNRTQLSVLLELTGEDNQTLSGLAKQVSVTNQSMTAISSKLVELGYVERVYNSANRREVALHITDAGRKFQEETLHSEIQHVTEALRNLNNSDFLLLQQCSEQLYALLERTDFGLKLEYKKDRNYN